MCEMMRWIHLVFSAPEEVLGSHPDGELNRDGWHRIRTFHVLHVLLEMTKPYNDILFVFFEYFDCTENTVRIWISIVTWKIKPFSISFALVFTGEVHEGIGRRSWNSFCDFGRRNFVWHWSEKFSLFCLSMMIARATFWKAFRTGVADRSEGDIMNHV